MDLRAPNGTPRASDAPGAPRSIALARPDAFAASLTSDWQIRAEAAIAELNTLKLEHRALQYHLVDIESKFQNKILNKLAKLGDAIQGDPKRL